MFLVISFLGQLATVAWMAQKTRCKRSLQKLRHASIPSASRQNAGSVGDGSGVLRGRVRRSIPERFGLGNARYSGHNEALARTERPQWLSHTCARDLCFPIACSLL
jgi:hypothetical protein